MMTALDLSARPVRGSRSVGRPVEKLIEYRRAHFAAYSEAASYFTNTSAQVQFCFANPIICELKTGFKIMRVDDSAPFEFRPGDVMYVPPGLTIDVDLTTATEDDPIECDCIEIELGRVENILARLNEHRSRSGGEAASVDWSAFSVLRGQEAQNMNLSGLMGLFRGERDMFTDLRIDSRIDDTFLSLLQTRSRDLLITNQSEIDTGIGAAARLIRDRLDQHVSVEELAKAACMSESSLHRHFRKLYGTTPARFATQLRISAAKRLLRQTDEPLEALGFRLGFSDASHFGRVFRKATGESPAEYRRRRKGQILAL
jgi:AraC-like DNA-binding protein/uncharacterized cupin superfamily protein